MAIGLSPGALKPFITTSSGLDLKAGRGPLARTEVDGQHRQVISPARLNNEAVEKRFRSSNR
jgi:hypothetical protein